MRIISDIGDNDRISINNNRTQGAGLEVGEITQFYGGPATGKTHLCHTMCVVLPHNYQAIYINTDGGFREDSIKSITDARGLEWKNIGQKIRWPNLWTAIHKGNASKK